MLNPVPAVMVSVRDKNGNDNIITVAWAGTVCTNPPMVSISVKPERFSHHMIAESGEFVINLVNEDLVFACDYCGVKSGKDTDKWKDMHLTKSELSNVKAPGIAESPVNLECQVRQRLDLGSHTMFVAEVVGVTVDEKYMDEKGKFCINDAGLIMYSHGSYFKMGDLLGTFGFSVKKS